MNYAERIGFLKCGSCKHRIKCILRTRKHDKETKASVADFLQVCDLCFLDKDHLGRLTTATIPSGLCPINGLLGKRGPIPGIADNYDLVPSYEIREKCNIFTDDPCAVVAPKKFDKGAGTLLDTNVKAALAWLQDEFLRERWRLSIEDMKGVVEAIEF